MNNIIKIRLKKVRCSECEDYMKLVNCDTNKVITSGDYYHDKIEEEIYGFISGLRYAGVEVIQEEGEEFVCAGCDW